MKQRSGSVLSLLLLGAICVVPNTWMASGADAPVTAQAQGGAASLAADVQKDVAKVLSLIPYKKVPREKVKLPKRSMKGAYDDQASLKGRRFVPGKY